MVVDGKFWRGSAALLESVGAHEPHIDKMRESIRYYIRQAIIPLMAYAQQYEPHQALINLVTQEYIKLAALILLYIKYILRRYNGHIVAVLLLHLLM